MLDISDSEFDSVFRGNKLVLLDFFTQTCVPCKMTSQAIQSLVGTYSDKVAFLKLDIEKNPETPRKLNVRGVPTIVLFRDGTVLHTHRGPASKGQIEEIISRYL